jgi:uncharacterized protein YcaQ
VRARGPLGNRDVAGERVEHYRGGKDSAVALYYLWLTGELMIHHRQGFDRVYDLRERVAPSTWDYAASEEEAEHYFARKTVAFKGMVTERDWVNGLSGYTGRHLDRSEARQWLLRMTQQEEFAAIGVEDSKDRWFVLNADLPILHLLEAGGVPEQWRPLATTTDDEAVFLAPLDIVSTRGRSSWLFDFEYIWEVYKPAAKRRWGYYTLPILYGDRLVARLDPKLDRATNTLVLNGFWLEEYAPTADPAFASALTRGLIRFAGFLKAQRLNIAAIEPATLREEVRLCASHAFQVQA